MEIYIADEQGLPVEAQPLVELAQRVLVGERQPPETEVNVLLVDERSMSELQERFMGEEGPTDVLAFPMEDDEEAGPGWPPGRFVDPPDQPFLLGDVVICPAVAARQAEDSGSDLEREMRLLLVHGLLHLLGHDHADAEEARHMEGHQSRYLDEETEGAEP